MVDKIEPYIGPRPFVREDEMVFYGRDREAKELFSLIVAHPIVLLYAQSGAGKTSLLNAKIVPLLEEHHSEVFGSARVGGELLQGTKADDIANIYVFNALTSLQSDTHNAKNLVRASLTEYLTAKSHPQREEGISYRRVIIFDQFEEIFTKYPERWKDREGFFNDIDSALEQDRRLRVVFSMREDYIANMDPFAFALPERLRTRFRLERLREDAALLAVKKPLELTNRSFAPGAAEKLVKNLLQVPIKSATGTIDISGEFIEPVQLQVVCQKLWRSLQPEVKVIDDEYIEDYGDVDKALSTYYDDCIKNAAEETGVAEGVLRRWFGEKLITPDGTRGTIYKDVKYTGGLPNEVVDLLENLRLVRPELRGGAAWYELTHDRFIGPIIQSNQQWLNERLNQQAKGKVISQKLEAMANEWASGGKSDEKLLSENELFEATQWVNSPEAAELGISSAAKDFVQISQMVSDRKRADILTRTAKRQRQFLIALAILTLISLVTVIYAIQARRQAEDATLIERGNIARYLAAEQGKEIDALILGIRAVEPRLQSWLSPPSQAVEGLKVASAKIGNSLWLRRIVNGFDSASFSPDNSHVLTVSKRDVCVWVTKTGEQLFCQKSPEKQIWTYGSYTPDGSRILVVTENKSDNADIMNEKQESDEEIIDFKLQFLDPQHGNLLSTVYEGKGVEENRQIQFSLDGKRVAFASNEKVHVIDIHNGKLLTITPPVVPYETGRLIFSPQGTHVLWLRENKGHLWETTKGEQVAKLKLGKSYAYHAQFSRDGKTIFTIAKGYDIRYFGELNDSIKNLNIWDVTNKGKKLISYPTKLISVTYVLPTPDNTKIMITGFDENPNYKFIMLDISDGKILEYSMSSRFRIDISPRYYRYLESLRFSIADNGRVLSQIFDSGTVLVFDGLSGKDLFELGGIPIINAKMSADGRYLIISSPNKSSRIVDLDNITLNVEELSVSELFSIGCQRLRYQPEFDEIKDLCDQQINQNH